MCWPDENGVLQPCWDFKRVAAEIDDLDEEALEEHIRQLLEKAREQS